MFKLELDYRWETFQTTTMLALEANLRALHQQELQHQVTFPVEEERDNMQGPGAATLLGKRSDSSLFHRPCCKSRTVGTEQTVQEEYNVFEKVEHEEMLREHQAARDT